MNKLTDFAKGIITGILFSLIIFGFVMGLNFANKRDKEIIEYVEKQQAIELLREDYNSRDPFEFIETMPDVRRAADGAADEFIRKRDEAVQRFRSGLFSEP